MAALLLDVDDVLVFLNNIANLDEILLYLALDRTVEVGNTGLYVDALIAQLRIADCALVLEGVL